MADEHHLVGIDDLTIALGQIEVDAEGPNAEVNRMADRIATFPIHDTDSPRQQGQRINILAGISIDDELLMLAAFDFGPIPGIHTGTACRRRISHYPIARPR